MERTWPGRERERDPRSFATTRWSLVEAAGGRAASPASAEALESLCRRYWFPLYAHVRRQGRTPTDAEDLTQAFFARLLEKGWLRDADRGRGRFRTFLLVALKRFLANESDRQHALKRGGGRAAVPIDTVFAESRFAEDPRTGPPGDHEFDHRWAMTLLDQALEGLRREFAESSREPDFEALKPWLTAERGSIPYAEVAAALGVAESGARTAVHRFRKRFREHFRAAVADTVSNPADVDEEVRHVAAALGRVT